MTAANSSDAALEQIRGEVAQLEQQAMAASNEVARLDVNTTAAVSEAAERHWWSTQDAMTMSAVVLAFGAIVIAIAAFSTRAKDLSSDSLLRLYGTIMVITMAAFLVVAGYNDTQIAAPLGLLGTIAGYLLGREGGRDGPRRPPPPEREDAGPADATDSSTS